MIKMEDFHNSETRELALFDLGQWVIDTCLRFGCRPETAWAVAAAFVEGLRNELGQNK